MRQNAKNVPVVILALIALVASACGGLTPLGRATQAAHIEKEVVVRAKVEFEKLRMQGKVNDADYAKGVDAYRKYVVAQAAVAKAIAEWQRIGSAESGQQVQAALQALNDIIPSLTAVLSQFVDLSRIQKEIR